VSAQEDVGVVRVRALRAARTERNVLVVSLQRAIAALPPYSVPTPSPPLPFPPPPAGG